MSQDNDFYIYEKEENKREDVFIEQHELLPIMRNIREKRKFVNQKASWSNILKERKIRATAALLGVTSAVFTAATIASGNTYAGFLEPDFMIVSGLALGSLANKKDFFSTSSRPISFISSAIGITIGAAAITFAHNPNLNVIGEIGIGNFIKATVFAGITGGYLVSKGISDICTGLKWNKTHKEFAEKSKGKRIDAIENIKFDMYHEGRLATYQGENKFKETSQEVSKQNLENSAPEMDQESLIKEILQKQGLGNMQPDMNIRTPAETLDSLRQSSNILGEEKSPIEKMKNEIKSLREDLPSLSKEEVSLRMKKIQEMQESIKNPVKKTM